MCHGMAMRARWCTNGLPSIVAPKRSSQNSRQGFAGLGVQLQKTNQQNSQSKRLARSCADQGDSWAALCSGFTGVFVSMRTQKLTKQKDSHGRTGIFTDDYRRDSRSRKKVNRMR